MRWFSQILRRLAALFHSSSFGRDLDEEMRAHLEMQAEENQANGMNADEAYYSARRQFGNITLARERSRAAWGWSLLEDFVRDIAHGARLLRRSPGFTAVIVLTMALGIGATVAVFSVANSLLLRPLPYEDSGRLVALGSIRKGEIDTVVSPAQFFAWRDRVPSLEALAAYRLGRFELDLGDERAIISSTLVWQRFFEVLRARPLFGRTFAAEDHIPGAERTVVLSHRLWAKAFGSDPKIIGRRIGDARSRMTVIGVMPPGFAYPESADAWAALPSNNFRPDETTSFYLRVVGRLRPGVSIRQAQTETNAAIAEFRRMYPTVYAERDAAVVGLREQMVWPVRVLLLVILGAVACVLLIACANAANLLLARAVFRGHEIAVRVGLGAGRARIARQLVAEGLLLSSLGTLAGLALASASVRLFTAYGPREWPRFSEISMDVRVFALAAALTVITGIVFGLAPMAGAGRTSLDLMLRAARGTHSVERSRARGFLIAGEVALSLVLLTGAGLLMRTFLVLNGVTLGFRPSGVLTVELAQRGPDRIQAAIERLRAIPGVEAIGAITALPATGHYYSEIVELEGMASATPGNERIVYLQTTTPGYFRVMGIGLRRGRLLEETDSKESQPVTVVNEALVRRYFPNENPIGKRIRHERTWRTIVGVVGDVRHLKLHEGISPEAYFPYSQSRWWSNVNLVIRANRDLDGLAGLVRSEMHALDKTWLVREVRTMEDLIATCVAPERLRAWLMGAFALIAVAVAAIGIFGVTNYAVGRRTNEFGVRMALGAQRSDVIGVVLRQALPVVVAGLAVGLACSFLVTRVLTKFLFRLTATDPVTYAGACALFAAVALLAAWIPARRASRIDPLEALRYE